MPHGKKLGKEKLYDREDINFEDPGRVCFSANIIKILRKLIFSLSPFLRHISNFCLNSKKNMRKIFNVSIESGKYNDY